MNFTSNFFLIRTPLLPLCTTQAIFGQNEKKSNLLIDYYKQPIIQEAIYLTSNELYQQMIKYLEGEITDVKKLINIEETLVEYLLRMSSRCTPFGLFAGCSVGKFNLANNIYLKSIYEQFGIERSIRIDMDVQSMLANYFEEKDDFRFSTRYYVNSSIYKQGKKIRYIEYSLNKGRRNYNLTDVDYEPILGKLLKLATKGTSYNDLFNLLIEEGYDQEESAFYLNELIKSQLLVSEIEPSMNGEDFLSLLTSEINKLDISNKSSLIRITELINNSNNVNKGIQLYQDIEKELLNFNIINQDKTNFFQLDLNRNTTSVELSNQIKSLVFEGAKAILALNRYDLSATSIELFKEAFRNRYEEEPVRLMDALDIETGINYNNLGLYASSRNSLSAQNHSAEIKMDKYHEYLKGNQDEITITQSDLLKYNIDLDRDLPNSFSVLAKVIDSATEQVQIESISGPSFTNLLGRFCNSNLPLKTEVEEMLKGEEHFFVNKIKAEIVHLPQARLGNILNRPHLSEYEIPYLGKSRLPVERQLNVADLYLKMERNKLILFSKRLGKEIIPRLSSAHNFSNNSLPVYKFLCDLQSQGVQAGASWSWGTLDKQVFLPRVKYENIILSPARWKINFSELALSPSDAKNLQNIQNALKIVFDKFSVKRYIYYVLGDNKLLIDTRSGFGIEYLSKKIIKSKSLILEEFLFKNDSLLVDSPEGGHTHEIVVPFLRNNNVINKAEDVRLPKQSIIRSFPPGSKWIYYKVYMGVKMSNNFLTEIILPFVNKMSKNNLICKWFFIRYRDPQPHLRIRFLLKDTAHIGEVITEFSNALNYYLKHSMIANLQLDTYNREIERYGHDTMELSEDFFHTNSMLICNAYKKLNWDNKVHKLQFAVKVVDDMLNVIIPSIKDRIQLTGAILNSFGIGKDTTNKKLKQTLNKSYRSFLQDKSSFENLIDNEKYLYNLIENHKVFFKNNLKDIHYDNANTKISKNDINRILRSYIHMFINRLFDTSQNDFERDIYFFIEKYYLSLAARNKHSLSDH